jgi:hypothetical protein
MNTEPSVKFPVICPKCRQESLSALPIGVAAAALISGRPVRLYASCHDVYWDAHHSEIEQIREYMGAPWLDAQQSEQRSVLSPTDSAVTIDGEQSVSPSS